MKFTRSSNDSYSVDSSCRCLIINQNGAGEEHMIVFVKVWRIKVNLIKIRSLIRST